jgi:predicted dehydrogenase
VSVVGAIRRPRLGFAGAGWIGRSRLEAIRESRVADVAAIADPAVDGCLRDFDELLDRDLEGVVIATPNALHADQALAALERGLPVFCQKPLGRDAAETRAVVAAARNADVLLGVDLSYRHTAAARAVRDAVAGGGIGDVLLVDLAFHNAYGPDKPWFASRELAGGGCLLDLGVHLVDLALWTLGFPPTDVRSARTVVPGGAEVEHLAVAELDCGGAVVRIACSWHLHAGRDAVISASFHGTEGGAAIRNVAGSFYDLRAERYTGTSTVTLAEPPDAWGGRAAVAWAQRVARGERFDPSAEELVCVAEVLDAIYEAAR